MYPATIETLIHLGATNLHLYAEDVDKEQFSQDFDGLKVLGIPQLPALMPTIIEQFDKDNDVIKSQKLKALWRYTFLRK